MKNLFIILFSVLLLTSCSKDQNKELRKILEQKFLENLDDPDSYEFVSITNLEPYTSKDSTMEYYEIYKSIKHQSILDRYEKRSDFFYEVKAEFDETWEVYKEAELSYLDAKTNMDASYDTLKKILSDYEIQEKNPKHILNKAEYKFRANNKLGAKILGSYIIYYDDNLKIHDIVESDME